MTNKEIYDAAVANGLEFTYFKGEDLVPDDYEDEVQETFWEMERACAERNATKNLASEILKRDLESDADPNTEEKRVPNFIIAAKDIPESRKAAAYDCYAELRYGSNGFGKVGDYELADDAAYNDDRGFASFFSVK